MFLLAPAYLSLSLNLNLAQAASFGLADRVVEQKLANGLTVLMVERHQTPVVSLNMTFGVGGVNEQVGANRPGASLRTYGVQGDEDGRDEGL